MAGSRIKDVTGSQDYFSPELVLLVDKLATGTGDWLQARKLELSLLGNTYIQGSTNNVNWHDEITSSDIYFNISTDGGVNWLSLDADLLPEGTINKYYTEAKVSANSDVAANIAARHSHNNKSVLDNIINTGDGNNFLSDNGTYKNFEVITPLIVNGDINATGTVTAGSFVTVTGTSSDFVKGDGSLDSSTYVISSELNNINLQFVTNNGSETTNNVTLPLLKFNTSYIVTGLELTGSTFWDEENDTITTVLNNGVAGQHFQELFKRGHNSTGVTIPNGKPVAYEGSIGNSGNIRIKLAQAFVDMIPHHVLGLTTEPIVNESQGKITTNGKVRGIQTNGVNYGEVWNNGDVIYLSTIQGGLTNIMPEAPVPAIALAKVISAHSTNGTLEMCINYPRSFKHLSDINGTELTTDGQIAIWHNTNKYFDFDKNINNYALLTDLHNAVTVLDSSEIDFTLTGQQITASLVSGSIDESKLNISINTSLGLADSALQSELDPVFTAHTTYNIINGVGFLKNNGTGTWSYDNSTYQPLDGDLTSIAGIVAVSGLLRKTSADNWTLDTNTYLTDNQTITLSGDVSGSGTTSIVVTVADDSHNHIIANVDGLQTELNSKEPSFTKNTAFNKNFGTVAGTVTEGNDSRLSDNRTPTDNSVTYTKIATDLKSSAAISASDIDWSAAGVFTKTLTAALTLTFSNLQLNKVITAVLTGDYTVTLPASVKIISGTYDGTVPNYLQFHCTDATTPVVWCVISQEA